MFFAERAYLEGIKRLPSWEFFVRSAGYYNDSIRVFNTDIGNLLANGVSVCMLNFIKTIQNKEKRPAAQREFKLIIAHALAGTCARLMYIGKKIS